MMQKYIIALKTITFSEIFTIVLIWPTFSQMYLKRAMQKEVYVLDRNRLINVILAHNTFSILNVKCKSVNRRGGSVVERSPSETEFRYLVAKYLSR